MAWLAGLVQAGSGAITSQYAAHQQNEANKRAAERARVTGAQSAAGIGQAEEEALLMSQQGQAAALGQYDAAQSYAEAQRAQLAGMYAPARQVGSDALQRYQAALMGNHSAAYGDPAFAFRTSAANDSAARLAGSAGLGNDSMAAAGVARYNQAFAGQEYRKALMRLQGLSAMGSRATLDYANADQSAFGNVQAVGDARAGLYDQAGRYNSMLTQNSSIAAANAQQNLQAQISDYDIEAQNALLRGDAQTMGYANQAMANAMYYGDRQRGV